MFVYAVYDSFYGNTLKVVEYFEKYFLLAKHRFTYHHVNQVDDSDLKNCDVLLIASPTRGFRPTKPIMKFLKQNQKVIKTKPLLLCDTRINISFVQSKLLNRMVKWFGYANDTIYKWVKKHHCQILIDPLFFIVKGSEGPLDANTESLVEKYVHQIIEKK